MQSLSKKDSAKVAQLILEYGFWLGLVIALIGVLLNSSHKSLMGMYVNHPLIVAGLGLVGVFGILWMLLKSGLLWQVTHRASAKLIQKVLLYGFFLSLCVTFLGFGLAGWNACLADTSECIDYADNLLEIQADLLREKDMHISLQAEIDQLNEQKKALEEAICALKDAPVSATAIHAALQELEHGNTEKAKTIFKQIAKENEVEAAAAYRHLGAIASLTNTAEAITAYQRAVEIEPTNPNTWLSLGSLLYNTGQWKEAEEAYKKVLALGEFAENEMLYSAAYVGLGNIYRDLGQVEKAIEYYEQALTLYGDLGEQSGEGGVLGNMAILYGLLGQVDKAIEYHEQALSIYRELEDRQNEGIILDNLGLEYHNLGQIEKAIEYHEQSLAISREFKDRRGEGKTLGNLGLAYYDLGQVDKAIEYYEQALTINREIGDRQSEGNQLGNLGFANQALGKVEQAIEYYEQTLAIHREIGFRWGEEKSAELLGKAYYDLGQVDKAIEYYEQALTVAREIGYRQGEGSILNNLGIIYHALGQAEKAKQYLQESLAIFEEIKSPYADQVRKLLEDIE